MGEGEGGSNLQANFAQEKKHKNTKNKDFDNSRKTVSL